MTQRYARATSGGLGSPVRIRPSRPTFSGGALAFTLCWSLGSPVPHAEVKAPATLAARVQRDERWREPRPPPEGLESSRLRILSTTLSGVPWNPKVRRRSCSRYRR